MEGELKQFHYCLGLSTKHKALYYTTKCCSSYQEPKLKPILSFSFSFTLSTPPFITVYCAVILSSALGCKLLEGNTDVSHFSVPCSTQHSDLNLQGQ